MYYELAGPNCKALKKVATPYIPDSELCPEGVGAPKTGKIPNDSTPEDKQDLSAAQPGGRKPHETKKMNKSTKTKQWSKGEPLAKWTRIDKQAKAFRTTNKNGPPWHQVVRR
eukprot:847945-Amphidinium_carterae.1